MTKKKTAGVKRRRTAASYRKIAISLPAELAKRLKQEVRATHAASVSAYVSDALQEIFERDRLQEALDEIFRDKPMTEKERKWADKMLGL